MPCLSRALNHNGAPVVEVAFAAAGSIRAASSGVQSGFHLFNALIDTGADMTCVSPVLVHTLNLEPISKTSMSSASHSDVPTNVYLVDITFPFGDPRTNPKIHTVSKADLEVAEFQMAGDDYHALLGRDIINLGMFQITGYDNRFTFCL